MGQVDKFYIQIVSNNRYEANKINLLQLIYWYKSQALGSKKTLKMDFFKF